MWIQGVQVGTPGWLKVLVKIQYLEPTQLVSDPLNQTVTPQIIQGPPQLVSDPLNKSGTPTISQWPP